MKKEEIIEKLADNMTKVVIIKSQINKIEKDIKYLIEEIKKIN